MNNPVASIIIPNYNCGNFIEETVSSVSKQKKYNFEIIIVDDGSSDNSKDIYNKWANLTSLHVIYQKNTGVSAARNAGMYYAQGKFIFFIDADDVMCQGSLDDRLDILEDGYDFVFGEYIIKTSSKNSHLYFETSRAISKIAKFPVYRTVRGIHIGKYGSNILLSDFSIVWTGTVGIRSELAKNLGGFNEQMRTGEDTDFWMRALSKARTFCLLDPLAIYNIWRGSTEKYEVAANKRLSNLMTSYKHQINIPYNIKAVNVRRESASIYSGLIYKKFISRRKYRQARSLCMKGLMIWPLSVSLWRYLLVSFMPDKIVSNLQAFRASYNRYMERKTLLRIPRKVDSNPR